MHQISALKLRRALRPLLALIALVIAAPAAAQPGGQPHIRAALIAETVSPTPGSITDVAIQMTPAAPWHGYWKNGGDAGFGMQVEWTLPRGVTMGDLRYPVPDTLVISGLMNHVFERPYALIAPLTVARDVPRGTRLTIRGDARWLACTNEICVPEQGVLTLGLVVGDGAISTSFDAMRAALPQPLGEPAHYQVVGQRLRIAIPLPATLSLTNPHLFVETARANQPGAAQYFSRNGHALIIETVAGDDIAAMQNFAGLLRIAPGRGLSFTAVPGAVAAAGVPLADTANGGAGGGRLFLTAFIGAIIGGLILNIMPCVFPILSLKALSLAKAGGEPRTVRAEGFAYTAGAVLTCLALGAILLLLRSGGEAVGWAFQLQRSESVLLLIILMGAVTANLFGLFEFGSLSFASRTGDSDNSTKSAFMTGALAAFIATPCTGPFLGAALGATLTLPAWAALPIFGGLGLGLALPFLALALIPALRTRLPKPGPWMAVLRRWSALPMALTALALVWLLSRQVGAMGWVVGGAALIVTLMLGGYAGRMQARGASASIAIFAIAAMIVPLSLLLPAPGTVAARQADALGSQPWSAAAQASAIASGRPVFVYFTADWCVSCKVNEAAAINRDTTVQAFHAAGVTTLVGDWTNADPAITRELARHGRNSVPLYLWYSAGGDEPEILPQILTSTMLAERATR